MPSRRHSSAMLISPRKAVQDDADLLFGRVTPARRPADILDDLFRRQSGGAGLLSHLRSPEGYDELEILPSSSR